VSDETETDSSLHAAYLFQMKAENIITEHAANYPDDPMFLYYAMQLIHDPFEVPDVYLNRCSDSSSTSSEQTYCGMNVMLDEAIANLTCALRETGMDSNLVFIISSDNGGSSMIEGSNYPYKGSKTHFTRGGISSTALIVSNLIDTSVRGTTYDGLMHISGMSNVWFLSAVVNFGDFQIGCPL
jgi:arylsulfatase B